MLILNYISQPILAPCLIDMEEAQKLLKELCTQTY